MLLIRPCQPLSEITLPYSQPYNLCFLNAKKSSVQVGLVFNLRVWQYGPFRSWKIPLGLTQVLTDSPGLGEGARGEERRVAVSHISFLF